MVIMSFFSQELESFLDCLKKIFAENLGVSRITMSLLCTLEQIFADQLLSVFEFDPDSSPALRKIIELVITVFFLDFNFH